MSTSCYFGFIVILPHQEKYLLKKLDDEAIKIKIADYPQYDHYEKAF